MEKRKIIIGTYDTALDGLWTLTTCKLGKAEAIEYYAEVPGHNGPLDLSTVLTDGEPYYNNRPFEAILESSEGSRLERKERIDRMINMLDGYRANIILPDDPHHFITGRVKVEELYNDLAHCSVRVSASVEPWRYNASETVVGLIATTAEQTVSLINNGRRSVVPAITVTGGTVHLTFNTSEGVQTWSLPQGEYRPADLPDLYLKTGASPLTYSGGGTITLTYREAVL